MGNESKGYEVFSIKLSYSTDPDIIQHIMKKKNKNAYLKKLIKQDMRQRRTTADAKLENIQELIDDIQQIINEE